MQANREEEIWAEATSMVPMLAEKVYDSGDYQETEDDLYRYMADLFEAVAKELRTKSDIRNTRTT